MLSGNRSSKKQSPKSISSILFRCSKHLPYEQLITFPNRQHIFTYLGEKSSYKQEYPQYSEEGRYIQK